MLSKGARYRKSGRSVRVLWSFMRWFPELLDSEFVPNATVQPDLIYYFTTTGPPPAAFLRFSSILRAPSLNSTISVVWRL